jgi:hypothetical protein
MSVTTILVESDKAKITEWTDYITQFDRETSKTSALDLSGLGTPKQPKSQTLESVLELIAQGSSKVVLLYTHGYSGGLLMRITTNSNSADITNLKGISRAWKAVDEVIAIRGPKESPQMIKRFVDLFTKLTTALRDINASYMSRLPNLNTVTTQANATVWFDAWMDLMAKACLGGGLAETDLRRVCRAMQAVRNLKLDRVEIRACGIGKVKANLDVLKEFFGAIKVLAPKVTMFFGKAPINLNPTGDLAALAKDIGGYRGTTYSKPAKAAHKFNTVTGAEKDLADGKRNRIFPATGTPDAIMQMTEVAAYSYKGRFWATTSTAFDNFLGTFYKSGHKVGAGKKEIPVGGLWTASDPNAKVPFILPLEAEYRDYIESSS